MEIAVALPIVLIALGMFVQMLSAGTELRRGCAEDWSAGAGAQQVLEEIRNEPFRDVFRLYNADPFDDPAGPGTAPGSSFTVEGLMPRPDDPDRAVGSIVFPFVNVGSEVVPVWQVREDILVDDLDHSDDFTLLPVLVRIQWQGRHGPRELRLHTVFSELR
jgi:hypothetical protein